MADPAPWSAGEGGLEATHSGPTLSGYFMGEVYVDQALPFGLRSALKVFTAIADMHFIRQVFRTKSTTSMFPATDIVARLLSVALQIVDQLGTCGITLWA